MVGFPRQCEHWFAMTVLTREVALGWGVPRYGGRGGSGCRGNGQYPGTAVEGKATAVARGSGSEAVAESCGGTVLLKDSGTREKPITRGT